MILFFVMSFPIWRVHNVEVEGSRFVTGEKIKAVANVPLEESIFLLDLDEIGQRFKSIVQIKKIKIIRSYPGTIKIRVEERQPYSVVMFGSVPTLFDNEGYVLARKDLSSSIYKLDVTTYPVIRGIKPKDLVKDDLGSRINIDDRELIKKSLDQLKKFLPAGSIQIDISERDDIVVLIEDFLKVKLGSMDDIEKKIKILSALIDANREDLNKVTYIDLRLINDPVIKFKD
jgi:cell division septal protein FtsQ